MFQRALLLWKQGLKVDSEDIRRNTVFTVASMTGGGILRPELASVVLTGDGTVDIDNLTLLIYQR